MAELVDAKELSRKDILVSMNLRLSLRSSAFIVVARSSFGDNPALDVGANPASHSTCRKAGRKQVVNDVVNNVGVAQQQSERTQT